MSRQFVDLLPLWVTWLWLVALTAVLVLHCGHFVKMGGQHRWWHSSHILMLVSQIYMYASMAYTWTWFSHSLWVTIFWISSAAIAGWMILRFVQRRPFSFLWVLALIMQVTMAYMWMPTWAPALTWTLVVYFGLETIAWLGGYLNDARTTIAVGPGSHAVAPSGAPKLVPAASGAATRPAASATGVLESPKRSLSYLPLAHDSALSRVSMAVMAASMAYMFAAMQLMRSAM